MRPAQLERERPVRRRPGQGKKEGLEPEVGESLYDADCPSGSPLDESGGTKTIPRLERGREGAEDALVIVIDDCKKEEFTWENWVFSRRCHVRTLFYYLAPVSSSKSLLAVNTHIIARCLRSAL